MSIISRSLTVLLAMGAAAQAGSVVAQSASGSLRSAASQSVDLFARDRSVAVRDRPHPEYEAFGLRLGAFTAYPKLDVGTEYNDNIYAVASGEVSDTILRLKPEISIASGWSRNAISAYARGAFSRYSDYDSEDTDDYGFGASGRLDVTRAANLLAGADFAHLAEPRTSSSAPASTVSPIEYDMASAYLAGSQTRGRVRFSARGDVRSFTYEDGRTIGGAVVEQGDRDRTISSVTGRTDVALSPATALFVQATGNSRDYDVASTPLNPARDSSGYEVLAGANFEVGALARGEVAAGYIQQEFDSPAFGDVSGLGARASIEYFPTQLTTLTTTVSRTVEDAAIVGAGGYLSSSIGLQVDHELLRNVILGGQLTYAEDDYEGIDRTDERLEASLRATYLVNRRLGVSLAASSFKQTSSGANEGVDFNVNRLMLALVGQF